MLSYNTLWWKGIGKDHFSLRLQCNAICATLMSSCAQWKSVYVSYLMSIFRKSDTNQFVYRAHSAKWKCLTSNKKVHFMQWESNIIAFCLFVHLTWLTHSTHTWVQRCQNLNTAVAENVKFLSTPNAINCLQYTIFRIHNINLQNHFLHSVLAWNIVQCTLCALHAHIILKSHLHTLSSHTTKIIIHTYARDYLFFVFIPISCFCYFLEYFSTLKMVQRWKKGSENTK